MKKFLIISTTAIALTGLANAQTPAALQQEINIDKQMEHSIKIKRREDSKELKKLSGIDVPTRTMNAFAVDFGQNYTPGWSRLDNFDEATFEKDGHPVSAFYDYHSKLVGTTQNKTFADLPLKAQQHIRAHYRDYTPGDVMLFDDNENNDTDMILYGNQFDDKDSYFVELNNGNKKIVVQVSMDGAVSYFTRLK